LHGLATEKAVIFHALFPEVLALVTTLEEELDDVFVVALRRRIFRLLNFHEQTLFSSYVSLGMKLNQKLLSLE
jgi:hypothetical protein